MYLLCAVRTKGSGPGSIQLALFTSPTDDALLPPDIRTASVYPAEQHKTGNKEHRNGEDCGTLAAECRILGTLFSKLHHYVVLNLIQGYR